MYGEPIPGYEGIYEITRKGVVWSLPRVMRNGARSRLRRMGQRDGNGQGHMAVCLTDKHGVSRKRWVHRLVAITYIPNPEGHPYVLHGPNGVSDNSVENLRWGTPRQNIEDMYEFGNPAVLAERTHCKYGHEFTESNTYRPPKRPNERMCKLCASRRSNESKRNRRRREKNEEKV